jgi:hypothetical protein
MYKRRKILVIVVPMRRSCDARATAFSSNHKVHVDQESNSVSISMLLLIDSGEKHVSTCFLCTPKKITRRFQVHC